MTSRMTSRDDVIGRLAAASGRPWGRTRSRLTAEAVAMADMAGDDQLAIDARLALAEARYRSNEEWRALGPFIWLLSRLDKRPDLFDSGRLRRMGWSYERAVPVAADNPAVSTGQLRELETGLKKFARFMGGSMHAVHGSLLHAAIMLGLEEEAAAEFDAWRSTTAHDGAEPGERDTVRAIEWASIHQDWEAAVAAAEPVLSRGSEGFDGEEQPGLVHGEALLPLLASGRSQTAWEAHVHAYRALRSDPRVIGRLGKHLEYLALSGRAARGLRLMRGYVGRADEAQSARALMDLLAGAVLVLRESENDGRGEEPLDAGIPSASTWCPGPDIGPGMPLRTARELMEDWVRQIAARYDARNGNTAVSTRLEVGLARQPFVSAGEVVGRHARAGAVPARTGEMPPVRSRRSREAEGAEDAAGAASSAGAADPARLQGVTGSERRRRSGAAQEPEPPYRPGAPEGLGSARTAGEAEELAGDSGDSGSTRGSRRSTRAGLAASSADPETSERAEQSDASGAAGDERLKPVEAVAHAADAQGPPEYPRTVRKPTGGPRESRGSTEADRISNAPERMLWETQVIEPISDEPGDAVEPGEPGEVEAPEEGGVPGAPPGEVLPVESGDSGDAGRPERVSRTGGVGSAQAPGEAEERPDSPDRPDRPGRSGGDDGVPAETEALSEAARIGSASTASTASTATGPGHRTPSGSGAFEPMAEAAPAAPAASTTSTANRGEGGPYSAEYSAEYPAEHPAEFGPYPSVDLRTPPAVGDADDLLRRLEIELCRPGQTLEHAFLIAQAMRRGLTPDPERIAPELMRAAHSLRYNVADRGWDYERAADEIAYLRAHIDGVAHPLRVIELDLEALQAEGKAADLHGRATERTRADQLAHARELAEQLTSLAERLLDAPAGRQAELVDACRSAVTLVRILSGRDDHQGAAEFLELARLIAPHVAHLLEPDDGALDDQLTLLEADVLLARGDAHGARALVDTVLRGYDPCPVVLAEAGRSTLVRASMSLGETEEAVSQSRELLDVHLSVGLDSLAGPLFGALAASLIASGRPLEAAEVLETSLSADAPPILAEELRRTLVSVLERLDDAEGVRDNCLIVAETSLKRGETQRGADYLLRAASACEKLGESPRASRLFERAAELVDTSDDAGRVRCARYLRRAGRAAVAESSDPTAPVRPDDARALMSRAWDLVESVPDSRTYSRAFELGDWHDDMAWILWRTGEHVEALEHCKRAFACYVSAKDRGTASHPLTLMALIHAEMGETDAAREDIARLRRLLSHSRWEGHPALTRIASLEETLDGAS